MILHVLVLSDDEAQAQRLVGLLPRDEAVASHAAPNLYWAGSGPEPCDLLLATAGAVPEPMEQSLEQLRSVDGGPELVVVLDGSCTETRARFQSAGAFAVVDGDISDDSLRWTFATLVERRAAQIQQSATLARESSTHSLEDFSSRSPSMSRVLQLARRVAGSDSSLLVLGETGVGKEWLARAVHESGTRAQRPFVAVNCAAIPDSLLESELFGHEKGAFTGARRSHSGYFEQAQGGTLFLDEIGEMPAALQTRLLRVLQEGRVQRLGAEKSFEVDVRVMAATNRPVREAVGSGTIRKDLYYRLAVVSIELPPLRDRVEDIGPLFRSHIERFRRGLGRWHVAEVAPEVIRELNHYEWPGNVRELVNVAERAVLLCDGPVLTLEDLPILLGIGSFSDDRSPWPTELFSGTLQAGRERVVADFEREYLARLLQQTSGRIGAAAEKARINPRTLYSKMQQYGLDKARFRAAAAVPDEESLD